MTPLDSPPRRPIRLRESLTISFPHHLNSELTDDVRCYSTTIPEERQSRQSGNRCNAVLVRTVVLRCSVSQSERPTDFGVHWDR